MNEWRRIPAILIDREGVCEVSRSWMFGNLPPTSMVRPVSSTFQILHPDVADGFPAPPCVVIYDFAGSIIVEGRVEMVEFKETYRGPVGVIPR